MALLHADLLFAHSKVLFRFSQFRASGKWFGHFDLSKAVGNSPAMSIHKIAIASSNATETGTTRSSPGRINSAGGCPFSDFSTRNRQFLLSRVLFEIKRFCYQIYIGKTVIYDATVLS
jgi:hypothetical protein